MHMATKDKLDALRLPELQARFKEVVGEATKSPNRKFLIRRIEEALAKKALTSPPPSRLPRRAATRGHQNCL
jgi:hypothetical protein